MVKYVLRKTLFKHSDSINALAFTHDGSLFASGADDGLIVVFRGNGHGEEVRRFQMKAPITALLWHSRFGYTIIAGDACGDVHTICLNNSADVSASRFFAYLDVDDIPFTEKHILPYFQQCLWTCSQHRAKRYIAGHRLWECCGANQARNTGFVSLPW
jgi:WD40 repeat protein